MDKIVQAVEAWESPGVQLSARRAVSSSLPDLSDEDSLTTQAIMRVVYVLGITTALRSAGGAAAGDVEGEIRRRLDALYLATCPASGAS